MLDTVQVFAWTRMFAGYSRELPLASALRATFDPARPCELCLAVAKAKAAEQPAAPTVPVRAGEKLVLACAVRPVIVFAGARESWPEAGPQRAATWVKPVPVRPPRRTLA